MTRVNEEERFMDNARLRMRWLVYTVLVSFGAVLALAALPHVAAAARADNSEIQQLKQELRQNQLMQQKLQQQYEEMARKVEALSKNLKAVKVMAKKKAKPSKWVLKGTTFETRDKTTQIHIGARMQLDGALAANAYNVLGKESATGVQFRRVRLKIKGILDGLFPFKLQYDFADTNSGHATIHGLKDAYIGYVGLRFPLCGKPVRTEFLFGNQYTPFFGHVPSSWREFMEADLAYYTFEPPREVGGSFRAWQKHWNLWTGVTVGQGVGNDSPPNLAQDYDAGAYSVSGGLAVMPVNDRKDCRFLSISGSMAYHSTSHSLHEKHWDRFENTPDSHLFDTKLIDTGKLDGSNAQVYGANVMAEYGPFDFLARYYYASVVGTKAGDVHFSGWAAQMGYFLTPGDHRGFSTHSASFSGVHPVNPVVFTPGHGFCGLSGGWGAWQIALQGDHVNLNDSTISGGKETDISVALDWYLNYNVRVEWQVTDVLSVDGGKYPGAAPIIYGMRLQYAF